jgi:hypothetical protein
VAFVAKRQATALTIYDSGRCDLEACICSNKAEDEVGCLKTLYEGLFGGSAAPLYPELLAIEYVSIGLFDTYHEALIVAESQPCGKIPWPNTVGLFPPPPFACQTQLDRRMLQAGQVRERAPSSQRARKLLGFCSCDTCSSPWCSNFCSTLFPLFLTSAVTGTRRRSLRQSLHQQHVLRTGHRLLH